MKQFKKPLALAVIALAVSGCMQQQEKYPVSEAAPEAEQEKMAYAFGSSLGEFVGQTLDRQDEAEFVLDRELVITGFVDAIKGETKIPQAEAEELIMAMQAKIAEQRNAVIGGKALEEGLAYQEQNAKKDGVQVTESGLQYEVMAEGPEGGASPAATDLVKVHYHGTLVNGEVFDSSVDRGEPIVFPLNRVIPGWTEGVQLMSEGDKYRFVIPSDIAYGERGAGNGQIPPNATLIFEVELLEVVQPEDPEQPDVEVEAKQ
ncbi:FKBP-type peptidyl-prolyl cis-trans isomerase [Pseudidiomarina woesei]|uniref:Peptidyl-prolyl cis-trans isomerase n=1 Tax=Pseudidiomarina woesei TaxID=1381080 RepID=A0A0K6H3Z7_9GAMM|nr:FKBP-type peptidyl-prolyl cis-trans isomerase [Pseudidiomarina woesei]CUA85469.1 FKBP-type peptidyl-prolyl cis-trans isomerase [Pseudidiomarina woesei]